jgi:uncharacterized membrane protein YdbT with pleckstrin-like domain
MKYVERVLQPGETVEYRTRLHWIIYLRAIVLFVLALACVVASGGLAQDVMLALEVAAGVLLVVAIVAALSALIRRTTTEFAITDRRVIYKTGIMRRHTMEINRSKVETVSVDQSILGRVLDYGTVTVRGTGGSFEPIPFIGEPLRFRSHITAG